MRIARIPFLLISLALMASTARAQGVEQTAQTANRGGQVTVEEIIDRMSQAERGLLTRLKTYHPLIEVYIQNLAPDEARGWVPTDDNYILGQFHFDQAPTLRQIGRKEKAGLMVRVLGSSAPNIGDGFVAMIAPDWRALERKRYEFKYVRREFLGESRCFVFDVKPLRESSEGFIGRIWIEDRDYNLVRFNGVNRGAELTLAGMFKRTLSFHMDGWRVNVMPGVWLPSYIYSEETDLNGASSSQKRTRFKSQTRIWGYQAQGPDRTGSLTTIRIDEPNVADTSDAAAQLSPVLSQRRWEQEAEANVLERLEAVGLLAPAGEADKVLETVLNNLVVTNKLVLERPLHCRILLTSPLESFTIGRTIVLSRGLIDVLPDEASLATMLAHELSHVALGHPLIDTKFSFADRLMVADGDLLPALQFRHTPKEEAAADEKVIELLGKSPYRDKLGDAGLFLRVLADRSKQLPRLIQPHIGDYMAANGQMIRLGDLMQQAPPLMPDSLEQIAALQLGARLVVDPWSGKLTLDRSPAVPLTSVREKVPFAVTPLMPVIKYAEPLDTGAPPVRTVGEVRSN
jgi:peptidase M48-like protein